MNVIVAIRRDETVESAMRQLADIGFQADEIVGQMIVGRIPDDAFDRLRALSVVESVEPSVPLKPSRPKP